MKNITLLEAGKFLLALDDVVIASTTPFSQFVADTSPDDVLFLHLESFFRQQVPSQEADLLVITCSGPFAEKIPPLLVNRIVDECAVQGQEELLSPMFPERTRCCCPRVLSHGNDTALLLDIQAMYELLQQSAQDEVLLSKSEVQALLSAGRQDGEKASDQQIPEQKTDFAADNDDPIHEIIAWLVAEYEVRSGNGEVVFHIDDIPASLRQGAGLADKHLQYLVSKTLARCRRRA